MTRRSAAGLILASWAAALLWLTVREGTRPSDGLGVARRIAPGAVFYAVRLGEAQIGIASLTVDTSTTGYRMVEVLSLDLPADLPGAGRHVVRTEADLSRTFRLLGFRTSLSEGGATLRLEAATEDSLLLVRAGRSGQPLSGVEAFAPEHLTLPSALAMRLATARRLHPDAAAAALTMDPLSGHLEAARSVVVAESTFTVSDSAERNPETGEWRAVASLDVGGWRVERRQAGRAVEWVDGDGKPIVVRYPFGATLERGVFELIGPEYQRRRRAGVEPVIPLPTGLVAIARERRPDPAIRALVLRVARREGPAPEGAATLFAGGRQTVAGDTVRIGVAGPDSGAGPPQRFRNTDGRSAGDARGVLGRALGLALQRYGNAGDTITALVRWVAHDLQLDGGPEAPVGPVTVASLRRGGPEGKARLFVALARMAGYAARVVSGVVATEPDLPAHTWAEVWRGSWTAVDPVFGDDPASASLLRLGEGPARPAALVPRFGALRATVLSRSTGDRGS